VNTVGKELGVVVTITRLAFLFLILPKHPTKRGVLRSITGSLSATALDGNALALALEALGSNQTLDLGGLGVVLLALLGDGTADDELADVVLLVETEEATDLGGTLGAETLGDNGVGETRELTLALLDDAQGENGKVQTGDGTADGLALALTSAAGTVAAVAVGEEQTGTGGEENCDCDKYAVVWLLG
jgi:hypothetical protein